jgi:hypothetical protein
MLRSMAIVFLAGATTALAQPQVTPGTVHYTLDYDYVDSAGAVQPVGVLMPGLSLRLKIRMEYVPGFGSAVTFPSSLQAGTSGSGSIAGFWAGMMHLDMGSGGEGSWAGAESSVPLALRRRLLQPFSLIGILGAGEVAPGGVAVRNIQPAQFASDVQLVASANSAQVWQGVWTPASFTVRTLNISLTNNSIGIWPAVLAIRDANQNYTLPVPLNANYSFGTLTIPIIPAPAAGFLPLAVVLACRRRRS